MSVDIEVDRPTSDPARTTTARRGRVRPTPPLRARLRRDWPFLALTAPAVILLIVFAYIPLAGNVIAFQEYYPYLGIPDSPFVGIAQFERLFGDPRFFGALRNTLLITLAQLIFFFPLPILLAILLHGILSVRVKGVIQNIVYLPHFVSWVVVVALFRSIFGGDGLFAGSALTGFLTNPDTFIGLVTVQVMWKETGWGTIIFLAALTTIPHDLYEAAAVDGAGRWRRLWHVTLPGIRPVIVLLLILRLGDALTVGFEQILLQRDAVGPEAAEVLDTFVYYSGVTAGDWSYGAAAGLFKGVIGLILIIAANSVAHRLGEQGVYQRA